MTIRGKEKSDAGGLFSPSPSNLDQSEYTAHDGETVKQQPTPATGRKSLFGNWGKNLNGVDE